MARRSSGPDPRAEKPALAEALKAASLPARAPTPEDAPPPSTLPMTKAAREALRLGDAHERLPGC